MRMAIRSLVALVASVVVAAPSVASAQTEPIDVSAPAEVVLGDPATFAASAQPLPSTLAGTVYDSELYSPILGQYVPFRVYLPPQYFTDYSRRFPVVYMLHGAGGNYTEWSDSYLPEQLDALIAQGVVQPMLVVMPDGGSRTFWANWDEGPRWSDYVAQDVVGHVDTYFRTLPNAASRAIGGLSMGGVGALQIGMRHAGVFGAVGAHSPSIRLEPDSEIWFLAGDSFLNHDPIWLASNMPAASRITYWLDVGTNDWWRPNIEELYSALVSAGLSVHLNVFAGTHEAEYWIEHVPDYLLFYSSAMVGDALIGPAP
jgi:enterochelin esterase-like enzyme